MIVVPAQKSLASRVVVPLVFSTIRTRRSRPSYVNSLRLLPFTTANSRFSASHSNVRVPSEVRLPVSSYVNVFAAPLLVSA